MPDLPRVRCRCIESISVENTLKDSSEKLDDLEPWATEATNGIVDYAETENPNLSRFDIQLGRFYVMAWILALSVLSCGTERTTVGIRHADSTLRIRGTIKFVMSFGVKAVLG